MAAGNQSRRTGREVGWQKRRGKKLSARKWVAALMGCVWQSEAKLGQWAWQVGCLGEESISVQGVSRRVNRGAIDLIRALWGKMLEQEWTQGHGELMARLRDFDRVLVQDSTCFKLPGSLAHRYPGSSNASGKQLSQARLDLVYDLCSGRVLRLALRSFRRNDQSASGEVLGVARSGDLLIRDLGYAVFGVWKLLIDKKIDILSRAPHPHVLYLEKDGRRINILKVLKARDVVDINVLVGAKDRLPMRLVALKVPEAVARERRRRARADRDKRLNRSARYFKLLGWTILLTTLKKSKWSPQDLLDLYGLRWRIESFFKAVKQSMPSSCWHPRASPMAVELALQVRLLGLLWMSRIYFKLQAAYPHCHISLIRLFKWLSYEWRRLWTPTLTSHRLTRLLLYHSCYHKRKLPNYYDSYHALC
jgi:hypothetical protein